MGLTAHTQTTRKLFNTIFYMENPQLSHNAQSVLANRFKTVGKTYKVDPYSPCWFGRMECSACVELENKGILDLVESGVFYTFKRI